MKYNSSIFNDISRKKHYLSNNPFLPKLKGNVDFIDHYAEQHYSFVIKRFKRVFGLSKISKTDFLNVKEEVNTLINTVKTIENNNQTKLLQLAYRILNEAFEFEDHVKLNVSYLKQNKSDLDLSIGKTYNPKIKQSSYYTYDQILKSTQNLEKKQILHALICGASHQFCENIFRYEKEIYEIDPSLYDAYIKYKTFSDFIIWVFNDEMLVRNYNFISSFLIGEDNNPQVIEVEHDNLYQIIFQAAKAIYSLLLNEGYDEEYVQYDNPWNLRIGILIWDKIDAIVKDKRMFKYILDDIANMQYEDMKLVFNNVLSGTEYGIEMISDACKQYAKQ